MNEKPQDQNIADDEIDLRELFSVIWQDKWVVIVITTLFAVASVFYAINQPDVYKSEALLTPAEAPQQGGLEAFAGQLGGLASLAGANLGGGSTNNTQLAIEVLKSRQFTTAFIQKHNVLPDLMAVESWQQADNSIKYNSELYSKTDNKWLREAKAPYQSKPSMQEAFKVFSKVVTADIDKESGMITISVEHLSPVIAQQWVNWLIQDINAEMKARDVEEANRSIEFLTLQLQETKVADIRTVLYKLVEEQAKTIMFANVRDEYAFKTIDPAVAPEQKFKPRRAIICIAGTFLGGILSFFFLVLRFFFKRS